MDTLTHSISCTNQKYFNSFLIIITLFLVSCSGSDFSGLDSDGAVKQQAPTVASVADGPSFYYKTTGPVPCKPSGPEETDRLNQSLSNQGVDRTDNGSCFTALAPPYKFTIESNISDSEAPNGANAEYCFAESCQS